MTHTQSDDIILESITHWVIGKSINFQIPLGILTTSITRTEQIENASNFLRGPNSHSVLSFLMKGTQKPTKAGLFLALKKPAIPVSNL